MSAFVQEPARECPVIGDFDLCVVGGSCTGVFAAVRAARLGLTVALVEQNILLGGMAVAAQVNEWHSLQDVSGRKQIIGGLTVEVLDRLRERNAVQQRERKNRGVYYIFNSAELALELDSLVTRHSIRLFLKTSCVAALREGNRVSAVFVEDKSGRRAIRARRFIDASGDGDLLRRATFRAWKNDMLQPVSYQMLAAGTLLRHLDGREQFVRQDGNVIWRRWRDEKESTPECYHIPYRCLVPKAAENLLVAGRLLDADREAFGGIRVMVNMNQTGEAAGVASFLALKYNLPSAQVSPQKLREELIRGGTLDPAK